MCRVADEQLSRESAAATQVLSSEQPVLTHIVVAKDCTLRSRAEPELRSARALRFRYVLSNQVLVFAPRTCGSLAHQRSFNIFAGKHHAEVSYPVC